MSDKSTLIYEIPSDSPFWLNEAVYAAVLGRVVILQRDGADVAAIVSPAGMREMLTAAERDVRAFEAGEPERSEREDLPT